jgi:phospholipid transport system substrate-binding protein
MLALALAASAVSAQTVAPDALLKVVAAEVADLVKQDKEQAHNPSKTMELVETRILPLFDFNRMTQMALGQNWRRASPEEQRALVIEFRTLLVTTYSSALLTYDQQVIEFKPLRLAPEDTEVTVKTEIKQQGKEKLTLDYEMEMTPAGWKVYDIRVGGVSLVSTYRDTFADIVRDRGVDGLLKALSDKNRQSKDRPKPHRSLREIAILIMSAVQGLMPGGN